MLQATPGRASHPARISSYPTIDGILERAVNALGGEDAIRSFRGEYVSGIYEDKGKNGTFEMYSKAPNKRLLIRKTQGAELKEGFDGISGWRVGPQAPAVEVTGPELALMAREADFYQTLRLRELYPKMTLMSGGQVEGHAVYTIEATSGDAGVRRMYFDVDTGLLRQTDLEYETPNGPAKSSWRFDDYRPVDGVQMPFARSNVNESYVLRASQIRHDIPADDQGFTKPAIASAPAPLPKSSATTIAAPSTRSSQPTPSPTPIANKREENSTASRFLTVAAVSHSAQESDYVIPGQTNTNCTDYGNSVNCRTTDTPSRNGAVYRFTQVVRANGLTYTLTRTARWRWSSMDWLNDGESFPAEIKGKSMIITALRGGNQGKKEAIKYQILDIR